MTHYVIIGMGMAGVTAAETIRKTEKRAKITIINNEKRPFYYRPALSYYLRGLIHEKELNARPEHYFHQHKINVLNWEVEKISTEYQEVTLSDGGVLKYDRLLIATGTRPGFLSVEGAHLEGIHSMKTVEETKKLIKAVRGKKKAIVVGEGQEALGVAEALYLLGLEVSLVVESGRVLGGVVDGTGGEMIKKMIERNGVSVVFGKVKECSSENGVFSGVILENGQHIFGEVGVMCLPGKEQVGFLTGTSIALEEGKGIVVNEYLQTSVPGIYSAGSVVAGDRKSFGWSEAGIQGKYAAYNMMKQGIVYKKSVRFFSGQAFGMMYCALGEVVEGNMERAYKTVVMRKAEEYKKIFIKDNVIKGVLLVGDVSDARVFKKLIEQEVNVLTFEKRLLEETFDMEGLLRVEGN